MSRESAIAAGRVAAEEGMADTFVAQTLGWTEVDGLDVEGWVEQYVTPGKIQGSSRQSGETATRTEVIGGVERLVVLGGLHIPYGKPLPESGWRFVCTAVGDPLNAFRVGRGWRVANVPLDDATARRLDVYETEVEED